MFIIETEKFLISVNIIKEFYNVLSNITNSANLIFTNKLEEIKPDSIIKNTENLPLIKEDDDNNRLFPKMEKIYLNCMKIIFRYDYLMKQIEINQDYIFKSNDLNSSGTDTSFNRTHLSRKRKLTKKKTLRKGLNDSVTSDDNKDLFNISEEQTNAIENEKIKYKYRLTVIKNYAIGTLNTILRISNELYSLLDEWIIDSVHFQNNMMNQLIERLRKIVNQNLKIQWDFELDKFNIYKPISFKFKNNYKNPNEDIESESENNNDISYRKYIELLYKLYKDIQLYTIENEFISEGRFIDIFFKKHICINLSNLEETPLNKISYHQFYNFISQMTFSIEPEKGRDDLININHIFAIMSLFPLNVLDDYEYRDLYSKIQDKLKYHCFLTKEDYFNTKLWFEGNKIFNEYYDDSEDKKLKKFNMSLKEFLYELFKKDNGDINMEDFLNTVTLKNLKSNDEDFSIEKYIDLLY